MTNYKNNFKTKSDVSPKAFADKKRKINTTEPHRKHKTKGGDKAI